MFVELWLEYDLILNKVDYFAYRISGLYGIVHEIILIDSLLIHE